MTRIDFYLLSEQHGAAQEKFVCRLAEKAYKLGKRLYIHTASAAQTAQLDDLLWTFRAGSFLPHDRYTRNAQDKTPILLGHDQEPDASIDVLINMTAEVPPFFSRFERVAEIIPNDEGLKQKGRERYKFYRDRGYALEMHNL